MGCFSSRPADEHKTAAKRAQTARAAASPASAPLATKPEPVEVATAPVRRAAPVTEMNRATLTLKSTRDRAQQALDLAERQCDADMAKAVALKGEGKHDQALLVMKRRRLVRMRVDDAYARLGNAEAMLTAVETQEGAGQMLEAMKKSNAALAEFHKVCNAETMQRAKDDWTEQVEETQRIEEVLNSAVENGWEMPSDAEINEILAAAGEAGEEAAEEVPPATEQVAPPAGASPPPVLSPEEAREMLNKAEETPDVTPVMPVVENGTLPASVKEESQERRQPIRT